MGLEHEVKPIVDALLFNLARNKDFELHPGIARDAFFTGFRNFGATVTHRDGGALIGVTVDHETRYVPVTYEEVLTGFPLRPRGTFRALYDRIQLIYSFAAEKGNTPAWDDAVSRDASLVKNHMKYLLQDHIAAHQENVFMPVGGEKPVLDPPKLLIKTCYLLEEDKYVSHEGGPSRDLHQLLLDTETKHLQHPLAKLVWNHYLLALTDEKGWPIKDGRGLEYIFEVGSDALLSGGEIKRKNNSTQQQF